MRSTLLLRCAVFTVGVILSTVSAAPSPTPVQVQVVRRHVAKRSANDDDNVASSFSVRVSGQGHNYNLALEAPSASVFSKSFKYNVAKDDGKGNVIFVDDTPSQKHLREIEEKFYIDQDSDSAMSIRNTETGYKVHGIMNNLAIIPSNNDQYNVFTVKTVSPESKSNNNDFVDLHRNLTYPKISTRATITAEPEIWVIFDYENSQQFGQDRTKILDYLGVFFHAINNRYATFSEPSIAFKISGVTTIATRDAQPYLESNKVPDKTGSDIDKVLDSFSTWAYTNQASGPKFDMAAVISGVDLQSKDSSGVYSKSVAGLAYLSAACWKTTTRWYATSVTEDLGGYYDGMFSVAHEFAHNLGSPHDGSGDAASCSWDEGYIMSYKGWGTTNKFYFSPCSINLMKTYISSNQGSCVKSIQASTNIPLSKDNVGDRYDMKALCVKYTKQSSAVPEPTKTPAELCKNLSCRYPTPNKPEGYYSIVTLNHPPGDNTPCGTSGGKCVNGNCVTPTIG
ncbi:venom metalloproteinase antarease-like TtrivMP_A [Folsomia candida]|uniref:venom metalloproteinase antarease-like TtrivMP_A n=1 Tax=Folsomia candida TaxID=158441 RepID=UPI00160506D9|nr:venom metalloproteinase antarease-like TtrivMP_A [Folsomia candida]